MSREKLIDITISQRVNEFLRLHRMKKKDLAEKLHVTPAYITRLSKGQYKNPGGPLLSLFERLESEMHPVRPQAIRPEDGGEVQQGSEVFSSLVLQCIDGLLRLEQYESLQGLRIIAGAIQAAVTQAEKGHVTDKEGPEEEGGDG